MRYRLLWTAGLIAVVMGCDAQDETLGETFSISDDAGQASADASGDADDGFGFADVLPEPVVVDGGTDCDLDDASSPVVLRSCCNGLVCNGLCVELDSGVRECQCFGIQGGCPDDYLCCKYGPGGCGVPGHCGY